VSKAEYKFNAPFASVVGPSTRQLVDLSDPLHTLSVITTGQSGHPMSEHYSDQSTLWSTGGYHEMSMEHTDIIKNSEQHLVLEPGQ
jgi:penicillin amidase